MATRLDQSKESRERILEAAATVLASRGYHNTSVEEVASRARMSKGGLYFHFPSKDRMMAALVEEMADKLVAKVERTIGQEPDPVRRLALAISVLLGVFSKQRRLARVLLIGVVGQGRAMDKKFLPVRDRFASAIESELQKAVTAGVIASLDTAAAARVWLGALNEVILQWLLSERPKPIDSTLHTVGRLLFQSVGLSGERFAEALGQG